MPSLSSCEANIGHRDKAIRGLWLSLTEILIGISQSQKSYINKSCDVCGSVRSPRVTLSLFNDRIWLQTMSMINPNVIHIATVGSVVYLIKNKNLLPQLDLLLLVEAYF